MSRRPSIPWKITYEKHDIQFQLHCLRVSERNTHLAESFFLQLDENMLHSKNCDCVQCEEDLLVEKQLSIALDLLTLNTIENQAFIITELKNNLEIMKEEVEVIENIRRTNEILFLN